MRGHGWHGVQVWYDGLGLEVQSAGFRSCKSCGSDMMAGGLACFFRRALKAEAEVGSFGSMDFSAGIPSWLLIQKRLY